MITPWEEMEEVQPGVYVDHADDIHIRRSAVLLSLSGAPRQTRLSWIQQLGDLIADTCLPVALGIMRPVTVERQAGRRGVARGV